MIDALRTLIKQFMPFAQKKMGFSRPPRLFLRQDSANASNPLGKTGFYDPENESITLYITERHPKDILRSLSHELMHHTQKCNGDFDGIENMGEQGYAQNNPQMRAMEIKAYQAAVYFRDFEDSLRETIYYEHLQKGEKDKMSTKDWKNRELNMLLNEAWGFKFNTLQEFDEFSGTGEVQEEAQEEEIEEAARGSQLGADRAKKHCGSGQKLAGGICVDLKETCPPGEEEEEESLEESPSHPAKDREGNRTAGRRHKEASGKRVEEILKSSKFSKAQVKEALRRAIKIVKEQNTHGQEK